MNMRNLEQRLERLEQVMLPNSESISIIVMEYVPHGTLKGFKNDRGFYCERLPGESEEALQARGSGAGQEARSFNSWPTLRDLAVHGLRGGYAAGLGRTGPSRRCHSISGCKTDCRDEYESERDSCMLLYDDPDDADDLQMCLQEAKSTYDDCVEECES